MFKKTSSTLKKSAFNKEEPATEKVKEIDNENENSVIEDVHNDKNLPLEVKSDEPTVESESDNEVAPKIDDVNLNNDEGEKLSPEKAVTTQNVAEDVKVASDDVVDSTTEINQTKIADAGEQNEESEQSTADKPTVPIQTYLWEDVKRAKEQVSIWNFYCLKYLDIKFFTLFSPSR